MEKFAERFCRDNPGAFPSADAAYILAFALIMLNTDAHNPQAEKKIARSDFVNMSQYQVWAGRYQSRHDLADNHGLAALCCSAEHHAGLCMCTAESSKLSSVMHQDSMPVRLQPTCNPLTRMPISPAWPQRPPRQSSHPELCAANDVQPCILSARLSDSAYQPCLPSEAL